MPAQQHILNWLYSVLTSEYQDVNRTYRDVAEVLGRYPSLLPRTDVHTFPNGVSALLLHLAGTLPIDFRGVTYQFPISIWVPHSYPREPPLAYVTPTGSMVMRSGQHVDHQGQIFHPYLYHWPSIWDKSTLQDFLAILSDVFAKEPPVMSRPQAPISPTAATTTPHAQTLQQQHGQQRSYTNPATFLPPVPRMAANTQASRINGVKEAPPMPPPKEGLSVEYSTASQSDYLAPSMSTPSHTSLLPSTYRSYDGSQAASRPGPERPVSTSRYDAPPPLPDPRPVQQESSFTSSGGYLAGQQTEPAEAVPSNRTIFLSQNLQYAATEALACQFQHLPSHASPEAIPTYSSSQSPSAPLLNSSHNWHQASLQHAPKPAPHLEPPDLLDAPIPRKDSTPSIPAEMPPIPPNPQKDALIRQVAQALYLIRQASREQDDSSLAGLTAQNAAMQTAAAKLLAEINVLDQISALLTSNTAILHDALRKADVVMNQSRDHPQPHIDELLVAPSVASNQLYTLVADERAIGDTVFALSRAMEKGRISTAIFAKTTRSLAREWYFKKALIRKISLSMGLHRPLVGARAS